MKYRKFGRTDFEVSALGFGCMRLPILDGDDGKIDEAKAIPMIRYAIDKGVNYVDTAYPYHKGNSEIVLGKALKDGYRDKVKLATKMPVWLINETADFDKYLNEQLQKLDTTHIDMYMLHALNKNVWAKVKELGVISFLERAISDGRIKYAGFSFHDDLGTFKEIVDAHNWTFCQIQYNYMDINYQAGTEGLKYAADKGLAVIVMEPLKGGRLAKNPPKEIEKLWESTGKQYTPAEWALRWIWNHPEVSVILSGMGAMEQVEENLNTASYAAVNAMDENELKTVGKVKGKYNELVKVECTSCGYCMPCPVGVNIPGNFSLYNEAHMYNDVASSSFVYNRFFEEKSRAAACVECGVCETKCPQNIPVREHLKDIAIAFNNA